MSEGRNYDASISYSAEEEHRGGEFSTTGMIRGAIHEADIFVINSIRCFMTQYWINMEALCEYNFRISFISFDVDLKGKTAKFCFDTRDEIQGFIICVGKKDSIKLADFQAGTLDELIKKHGNKIGVTPFSIWICDASIRIYKINYDGIYRFLVANVVIPTEQAQFIEALKHRIPEVLTVIASNTPSRSTYVGCPPHRQNSSRLQLLVYNQISFIPT
ncbi:unnamed protein product [Rhizophagus irregularis]|nr:unnamed protein product [Rhizophagus irregularis]